MEPLLRRLVGEGVLHPEDSDVAAAFVRPEDPFQKTLKEQGITLTALGSPAKSRGIVAKGLACIGENEHRQEQVRSSGRMLARLKAMGEEWRSRIEDLTLALRSDEVTALDKLVAFGALFYLICPFDLIPDAIPVVGVAHDFIILGIAVLYYRRRFPHLFPDQARKQERGVYDVRDGLLAFLSIGVLGSSSIGWTASRAEPDAGRRRVAAPLTADETVKLALQGNPLVRAAQAQYSSALHQIDQAYVPQDPQLTWAESGSQNGLKHPSARTLSISESFQFPGKGWLQGDQAHRAAEIARLAYEGAVRDAGAQAQTAYYQALLDGGLAETAAENASTLDRVLKVAQVAYAANQVSQSDLISAEFDLSQATQTYYASQVAEANDEAALNQALGRDPREALSLAKALDLEPMKSSMDVLVDAGLQMRQELLEAALSEKNAKTALTLARLEFLPDFTVGYSQNRYSVASAAPVPGDTKDNTVSIGFNLPVFFWFKQRQDVESAGRLLDAARADRRSAELQTETGIVSLYRTTRLAYDTAVLYRDSLIPLARQDFQVALIAYQSGKVDFTTLSATLQRIYNARIAYLTAANQFLAGRVALQSAIGRAFPL